MNISRYSLSFSMVPLAHFEYVHLISENHYTTSLASQMPLLLREKKEHFCWGRRIERNLSKFQCSYLQWIAL